MAALCAVTHSAPGFIASEVVHHPAPVITYAAHPSPWIAPPATLVAHSAPVVKVAKVYHAPTLIHTEPVLKYQAVPVAHYAAPIVKIH